MNFDLKETSLFDTGNRLQLNCNRLQLVFKAKLKTIILVIDYKGFIIDYKSVSSKDLQTDSGNRLLCSYFSRIVLIYDVIDY